MYMYTVHIHTIEVFGGCAWCMYNAVLTVYSDHETEQNYSRVISVHYVCVNAHVSTL